MIIVSRVLIPMNSQSVTANRIPGREPPDSDLLQQRLPTWQPLINIGTMWKYILGFGVVMFILGCSIRIFVQDHPEIRVLYEGDCEGCDSSCDHCRQKLKALPANQQLAKDCVCHVKFKVTDEQQWKTPVYVYYELTDFHQNHRRYVHDRDNIQLVGRIFNRQNQVLTPTCSPPMFQKDRATGKFYFPCGSIANSMFTDGFELEHAQHGSIPFNKEVSWPPCRRMKFRNPCGINKNNYHSEQRFQNNFVKPMNWSDRTWKEFWENGGLENHHFIGWMSPAPFSTFRKLYGVIESGCGINGKFLCPGEYTLKIYYRYYMEGYTGNRSVILQTTSFLGTPKPFLKRFLIIIGLLSILSGSLFFYLDYALAKNLWPFLAVETILDPVPDFHSSSNLSMSSSSSDESSNIETAD